MIDVIFYEAFEEEQRALEKTLPSDIKARFVKGTIQEKQTKEMPASIVSVRTQSAIPLSWAKGLKGILTRSAGHDHLSAYRKKSGQDVSCGYLPSYCSRAVAEQAILMTMALWRKLPQQMKQVYSFSRDGLTGCEIFGKNVLVVGVGKIGGECVRIAKALGMNVKGSDIDPREKDVDYVQLEEGAAWADAVISAVPLTEKTRKMFNFSFFQKMRPGGMFVNISRGEASPLGDIKEALETGVLAGAGLDVYENEPELAVILRGEESSQERGYLLRMAEKYNVILTPHNAFNTKEAVLRKAQQSIDSIMFFLKEGRFIDEVPV